MRKPFQSAAHAALALSLAAMLGLNACTTQGAESNPPEDQTQQTVFDRDPEEQPSEAADEQGIRDLVSATVALLADPTQENLEQIGISSGEGSESGYGTYEDQLAYYHNLSIEVVSAEVTDNEATVELDVTNADFQKVSELAQEDSSAWRAENGGGSAGAKFAEFYNERLLSGDVETKTVRCTLPCSKQDDGSWAWSELPGDNQSFVAALSGVELPD